VFDRHPRGLRICFVVELWERFSFFGMQALLIFFLIQTLRFSEKDAYLVFGAYAAMIYMMPVAGGFIADKYLGARKSITFGAVLVILGHLTLAIEGPTVLGAPAGGEAVVRDPFYLWLFYLALAQIVVGVSFVKTSCMALVGALYERDDPRRDAGFTLYYLSINIGGAIAPLLCGWAAHAYGFRYGFGLAAIGMLIGLVAFRRGRHQLAGLLEPPPGAQLDRKAFAGIRWEWLIYASAFVAAAAVALVLRYPGSVGVLIVIVAIGMVGVVGHDMIFRCDAAERGRLIACGILILFTIGFWAFYQQMGTSLSLFADRYVDRQVFGHEISAPMLQAFPAIFILILAPIFSRMWLWLANRGREPTTATKFAIATLLLAIGFLGIGLAIRMAGAETRIPLGWLLFNFLLVVAGELSLVPMSQSMVTGLAPRRIVNLMVGCLLLSNSASVYVSSLMADLPTGHGSAGYATFYIRLGLVALVVCLALILVRPLLKRLTEEAPAA
jgi:POT family proton-dependent oligopeptide transporter